MCDIFRKARIPSLALAISIFVAADAVGIAETPQAGFKVDRSHKAVSNFYVVASERLANRIVRRNQTETGPVVDTILGAQVRGERLTQTEVFIDFRPNFREAHFDFCLNGVTQSDTVGTTPQALTRTFSCHSFGVSKPVYFDGRLCRTYQPSGWVVPRNRTAGVRTPVSGVPLIGPAVDRYTFSEVERRRPLGERIAAEKVLSGSSPKFNRSIDESLGKINSLLTDTVQPFLTKWHLLPDERHATSTDTRLTFQALVRFDSAPVVSRMPSDVDSDRGLAIAVHESLLDAWVDRMQLGGKSLTDREIDAWLENFTATLKGDATSGKSKAVKAADAKPEKPSLATIRLDDADPIRFRFADGQLILTVRAGLKPVLGADIPTQTISIPLELALKDGKVTVTPGKVSMGDHDDGGATLTLVRELIRQQITARLGSLQISGRLPIPAGEGKQVTLNASEITASDGWLVFKLE